MLSSGCCWGMGGLLYARTLCYYKRVILVGICIVLR